MNARTTKHFKLFPDRHSTGRLQLEDANRKLGSNGRRALYCAILAIALLLTRRLGQWGMRVVTLVRNAHST